MKWFEGDIATAITSCKRTQALLLVYITDTDEVSVEMDAVWEDPEMTDQFDNVECVCLKLPKDSVGGQQFAQIYTVPQVPCTYFVKADGKAVETIEGACSKEDLKEKTSRILAQHAPTKPAQEHVSGGAQAMASTEAKEETEDEINASSSYSPEEKEAKIERARELIRLKQEKKAAEEKQKARNAEIERRRLGQDMNKLKDFKAEQEAKETRDALRKEKEETRLAREKIREQIQKDRDSRKAKYEQHKSEKEETLRKKQQEKLAREAEEAARIAAANSSNARIQFRLPDGSKINHTFEADETLQSARNVVTSHESNPFGRDFRLATIYPRRVFTAEESGSTFRDLTLMPTSALLVLPPVTGGGAVRSVSSVTGSFSQLLAFVFSPILVIWNLIRAFVFASPDNSAVEQNQQPAPKPSSSTGSQATSASADKSNSPRAQRRVGRLSDLPPGDDDQNTWNGNSTQQM